MAKQPKMRWMLPVAACRRHARCGKCEPVERDPAVADDEQRILQRSNILDG
jgi:hypothetical protein